MMGKEEIVGKVANYQDFPGGPVVGNLLASAGNMGSIPGLGRVHVPQSN